MADYVNDPLNGQASALVDAQTDIKTAVKKGVLANAPAAAIRAEVRKIIDKTLSRIRSPTLKSDARISLMRFSDRVFSDMRRELATIKPEAIPFAIALMREITAKEGAEGPIREEFFHPQTEEGKAAMKELAKIDAISYQTFRTGLPLGEFTKTYMERVDAALDGIADAAALDPNDFTGCNSLRNLAEMQVRYEAHQQAIEDFKGAGVRLVVCSVHADCSPRCAPWQGRVYSLDGTSGTTEDGRKYVPLEEATDVYYTTKAGRTYKNGLLGFNCRHQLAEYKAGMGVPFVTAEQRKKQYAVTQTQRSMERGVIQAREKALAFKGANVEKYLEWRNIAIARNKAYQDFCRTNKRAFYPDRVKIL